MRFEGEKGGETQYFREVLETPLLESFQFYVRELRRSERLGWEEWARRWFRHNDPIAVLVHERLTAQIERALGRPIKKSYCYLVCYAEGATLPRHIDRPQCEYTFDFCIEESTTEPPWPLMVGGEPFDLKTNEGLLYRGRDLEHYREEKPSGKLIHLVFFHFVDAAFEGSLD